MFASRLTSASKRQQKAFLNLEGRTLSSSTIFRPVFRPPIKALQVIAGMGASNSREPGVTESSPAPQKMASNCPVAEDPAALPEGSCPLPAKYRSPHVYNVYNQKLEPGSAQNSPLLRSLLASGKLDPRNNMPLEPNQRPWPGQEKHISTERLVSTIPKGGTDSTWVYPSPQMFYNGEPEDAHACKAACSSLGPIGTC